jgi:hypothetical protein
MCVCECYHHPLRVCGSVCPVGVWVYLSCGCGGCLSCGYGGVCPVGVVGYLSCGLGGFLSFRVTRGVSIMWVWGIAVLWVWDEGRIYVRWVWEGVGWPILWVYRGMPVLGECGSVFRVSVWGCLSWVCLGLS